MEIEKLHNSYTNLQKYIENNSFKGYDPYDGLNSKIFTKISFISKNRFCRLIWLQLFKKSPFNFRKYVGIQKSYNPKALGLFLTSYCKLYLQNNNQEDLNKINYFIEKLKYYQSYKYSGACWGYNFDWESRAFFQPKHSPTIVASVFIAEAILDAYEITKDEELFKIVRSTCDFILFDLNRTYDKNNNYAFSYSPIDKRVVFNASLLGSRLLARVYSFTKEEHLLSASRMSVAFCCNYQNLNGSWSYGTLPFHQWVDNFHTGYNLECIADYIKFSKDKSFDQVLQKGFTYYINTFFTKEGIPKYYNNSIYPIDIHAPAQLTITLNKLGKIDEYKILLDKVLNWTIDHMQSKKGFFYFQKNKIYTTKISYMRWSQAWMFLSLTVYMNHYLTHNKSV